MVIARLIRTIAAVVAAVIVAAILLHVLGANPHNAIASGFHDVGKTLVGPFEGLFSVDNAKVSMAVNWGIAAIVYVLLGHFVARMIASAVPRTRWLRRTA